MTPATPIVPPPVPCAPESAPALVPGRVHLWHADLDDRPADEASLDGDERARAVAMIPRVRRRFVASRGLLRRVLGAYLAADPASIRFESVGEGKPRLAPFTETTPRFNLSHAGGRWLLAVSTVEVGVDVERTDRSVDIVRVAGRVFHRVEADAILAATGDDRRRLFFRAWTGREALVKARAEGMFTLGTGGAMVMDPSRPLALEGEDAWTVRDVPMEPPWSAALAVEGRPRGIDAFRVTEPRT